MAPQLTNYVLLLHVLYSTTCGELMYGDRCTNDSQCGFDHGFCDRASSKRTCLCLEDYPVTNHLNMCGKPAHLIENCVFNEQCESTTPKTECRGGRCGCIFQMDIVNIGGVLSCDYVKPEALSTEYTDTTTIVVMAGMLLIIIILCVVLRVYSNRWFPARKQRQQQRLGHFNAISSVSQ